MWEFVTSSFSQLMVRGGIVMWPLLGLSLLAVTLSFERLWFFVMTNAPSRRRTVAKMGRLLRDGKAGEAKVLAENDGSVYGAVLRRMLLDNRLTEAGAADAVESQRGRLERFMPMLSTIITASPMLGILGTVLGIISSFEILSDQTTATDPRSVSQGIAEALITTAAGLIVSLITLFPYNLFRAQIDRTFSRLESLANSALMRGEAAAGEPAAGSGSGED